MSLLSSGAQWAFDRYLKEHNVAKTNSSKKYVSNRIGYKRKVVKGKLGNATFQVNPTTIAYGGGGTWNEVGSPGSAYPQMQYGCGKSNTFTFELYINEWMFDHKVNADAFVQEIFNCRGSKKPVKFIIGKMAKDVIVNDCEILVESFNPDMSFREVRMNVVLTTIYK